MSFAGLSELDRSQVTELIDWKFQSMPHRRARAMKGVTAEQWDGPGYRRGGRTDPPSAGRARRLSGAGSHGGIRCRDLRFWPGDGRVLLAVCRPDRFTVADGRALNALRMLHLIPAGPRSFRLSDWRKYLETCRILADGCQASLRVVDRA